MKIVKVPFHGHELTAIETAEAVMVPLKPFCDRLGLDRKSQQGKINARKELYGGAMIALPSSGGAQKMLCLPITRLAMWLASINPAKVKPELRSMLELYQREAADVLDRYFRKGEAIPACIVQSPPDPEPPLPKLRAPKNPLAAHGWQGFEMADYIEYLQLKAWALEVENRRLRRGVAMSEVDHTKVRAHNEIMSALWRHVQACQGLAGLFQSVDRRNDVCIDYEGIGDLIQTLAIDMRRIVQQLDEAS